MIGCYYCGEDAKTIYCQRHGDDVFRRRECTVCGRRFITKETFVRAVKTKDQDRKDDEHEAD